MKSLRQFLAWLYLSLPDKVYIRILVYRALKRLPNIKNPQRFSDKIQWLKLHGRLERFAPYADKYTVRKFVESTIGAKHLIPLIGVWDNFDDIPFNALPERFVLKVTHGCGYNYICKDKSQVDRDKLKALIDGWLREDFYKLERESQYSVGQPRVICERYLEDESGQLRDYKFYCVKGQPTIVQLDTDRFTEHKSLLVGLDWQPVTFVQAGTFGLADNSTFKKPKQLPKMLELARKLSRDFPFVRVDLYEVGNRVYFGELTFTPGSGLVDLQPVSGDIELGKMIDLSAYSLS
ncbi:MAG TPA: ATP-grasp fold amidoligase family protein [Candidatus Saccharimonadales bacterium]|nr:ATP-grasp fold amidoligase family protein [Candidatus Saccharimonadales bacterium]